MVKNRLFSQRIYLKLKFPLQKINLSALNIKLLRNFEHK